MKKRDLLLVFLLTLFPRLFLSIQAYPLVYISDETSAISVAALAAGFDWTNVVSNAGYYGIGYLFVFAPLFHIIKNPIWIYRIILTILSITVSLSAPLCYMILYKFFSLEKRVHRIIIATLCGELNLFTVIHLTVRNEEILYLITWIIVYVLCDMLYKDNCKDKKYKKKEILLIFLLGYALTIHTRAVCLIFGIIMIDLAYRIIYKKNIIYKCSYLAISIMYLVINFSLKLYQSSIWIQGTRNTSVGSTVERSLSKIFASFNMDLVLNALRIIFGQIYTAAAVTGGLFIMLLFVLIFYFMGKKYKEDSKGKYIFVISGMFLFCTFITICGMAMTWLMNVTNDIATYGEGVYRNSYRAFAYLRYMGCYVSPFIMCALIIVSQNRKILKKSIFWAMGVLCVLTLFWIKMILPYICNDSLSYFITLGVMKFGEKITTQNWYLACILVLEMMMAGVLLIYAKKEYIYITFVTLLLVVERIYGFEHQTVITGKNNYLKADAGYELIQDILEKKDVTEIYVYDASQNSDHQIFYLYQFLNYSVKVIPEIPEKMEENILLFSNKNIYELLDGSYYWSRLDDNEYVYCTDLEYIELIEQFGITMNEIK